MSEAEVKLPAKEFVLSPHDRDLSEVKRESGLQSVIGLNFETWEKDVMLVCTQANLYAGGTRGKAGTFGSITGSAFALLPLPAQP